MTSATVQALTPEILLVAVAVGIYLGGATWDRCRKWSWFAGAAVLAAAVLLAAQHGQPHTGGAVAMDRLSHYLRWFALGVGVLFCLMSARPLGQVGHAEYVGSLLLAIAGVMLVAVANDLVLLFVGLEMISIPTYILLYLGRRDQGSKEAAAKYFFLSILASALLLYGLSFLYGVAGSTGLERIRAAMSEAAQTPAGFDRLGRLALVLIVSGLGFKIAAVPLHFYAPDVYQGTTHANAALLSVVPKAAGFVALVRLTALAAADLEPLGWRIVLVIAVLTMTCGNLLALWQDHLRRLLAYSAIAHTGYMLIGLAVGLTGAGVAGRWDGLGALLFYLAVYAVATIGALAALSHLGREGRQVEYLDELAGLGRARPWTAALLAVFMFSLAGVPPLAGFWGKLLLFGSALDVDVGPQATGLVRPWFVALAVVAALNAAVAAAYYLRVVAVMYFEPAAEPPAAEGGRGAWLTAALCALLVLGIGAYPGPLIRRARQASPTVLAAMLAGPPRTGLTDFDDELLGWQGLPPDEPPGPRRPLPDFRTLPEDGDFVVPR